MVAFGYWWMEVQAPSLALKPGQVRQVLVAEQVVSTKEQNPSLDSDEHATYGIQVSYGTCPFCWINSYTPVWDPPWQEPAIPLPQFNIYWIDKLISTPRPFRAILIRSANELNAPCAQQLPQYLHLSYYYYKNKIHFLWMHSS